ncbi:MAG TPA: GAF domain-containing protein [Candidatus Angelobacter sp.]|nr:GAF domain-containing protein [Candidatus Angelobacter sp.]
MIDARFQNWLQEFLDSQGGVAGTVHRHIQSEQKTGLELVAAVNIPPKVQEIVDWVPPGKGMAGQALVQGIAIQTCNLKDDSSGAVRPGAKAVNAEAAVALPVRAEAGRIEAIVGIAYNHQRSFAPEELSRLEQAASTLLATR